jgi:hypothetical protein
VMLDGAGEFVENVLVPSLVALVVAVTLVSAAFGWIARHAKRVTE